MGNSPPTGGLRPGNSNYSGITNIGKSAAIEFSGRMVDQGGGGDDGEITESWVMVYSAGASKCMFSLSKSFRITMSRPAPSCLDEKLQIKIKDILSPYIIDTLQRDEDGLLDYKYQATARCENVLFKTDAIDANGDITHTTFYIYWRENMKCLIVREFKRSKDKNPYTVTVAHYYVNIEDGEDVGLSVVVKKIRVLCNGNFDFVVDGPEKHPASALLYMFDEVYRTKTWKPTHCPHCASNTIQRQRAGIWQSESEDSDIDNVPVALLHGRRQNARGGFVATDGRIRGNNNGNLNIKNLIFGRRRR